MCDYWDPCGLSTLKNRLADFHIQRHEADNADFLRDQILEQLYLLGWVHIGRPYHRSGNAKVGSTFFDAFLDRIEPRDPGDLDHRYHLFLCLSQGDPRQANTSYGNSAKQRKQFTPVHVISSLRVCALTLVKRTAVAGSRGATPRTRSQFLLVFTGGMGRRPIRIGYRTSISFYGRA